MKQTKAEGFAIVVNSCDSYADLWPPFFALLKKYWPGVGKYPLVLNTETKTFSWPGLDVRPPAGRPAPDGERWSARLKRCLKGIDTEFVLLLLEDFFLEEPVDEARLLRCVEWMTQDKRIRNFSFVPSPWREEGGGIYPGFVLRPRKALYRVNLQAGLWRRQSLLSLLRAHESPWDFENYGTFRQSYRKGDYYIAQKNQPQVFTYNWQQGGAIHRGKWTPGVEALLEKNGIKIDFSRRGWDENPTHFDSDAPPTRPKQGIIARQKERLVAIRGHWRSLL